MMTTPIDAVLYSETGAQIVLPDPAGGTFNAAGIHVSYEDPELPFLGALDPDYSMETLGPGDLQRLLIDVDLLLSSSPDQEHLDEDLLHSRALRGQQRRGLVRLRALTVEAMRRPDTRLVITTGH